MQPENLIDLGLIIPKSVISSKLVMSEKLVASAILNMIDDDGTCSATNEEIAEVIGLSLSSVKHAVPALCKSCTIGISFYGKTYLPGSERRIKVEQSLIDESAEFARCSSSYFKNKGLRSKPTTKSTTKKETNKERKARWKIECMDYLNKVLELEGSRKHRSVIGLDARFNEGVTPEDIILIIDYKLAEWGDDEKMRKYIRPSTLFSVTHVPEYLREAFMWDDAGRPKLENSNWQKNDKKHQNAKEETKQALLKQRERLYDHWQRLDEERSLLEINPDSTEADWKRVADILAEQEQLRLKATRVMDRVKGM